MYHSTHPLNQKRIETWLAEFFDKGISTAKLYGVVDENGENKYAPAENIDKSSSFYYKSAICHKDIRNVLILDTATRRLMSKKEFKDTYLKNSLMKELPSPEFLFSGWSSLPLWEGRYIEKKILSFYAWETYEQHKTMNFDERWSALDDCLVGKDFNDLEPKSIVLKNTHNRSYY